MFQLATFLSAFTNVKGVEAPYIFIRIQNISVVTTATCSKRENNAAILSVPEVAVAAPMSLQLAAAAAAPSCADIPPRELELSVRDI